MTRLCVFCGSSTGHDPAHGDVARALGAAMAAGGIGLVFGGGHIGLMGIVADAVLAGGGEAIGVIPQSLVDRELAHRGLTELHITPTMHARKALMADLADGFVALPGGIGTLEELFEIWTWAQLGLHAKPVMLLDTGGFFAPLIGYLDGLVAGGFLSAGDRGLLRVVGSVAELLDYPEKAGKDV